jgi:hypothetical protein
MLKGLNMKREKAVITFELIDESVMEANEKLRENWLLGYEKM